MFRRILVASVLMLASLPFLQTGPVSGAAATPVVGDWSFCTTAAQVGCIEHFSFENASGVMQTFAALHEAQNAGVTVTARCYASGVAEGAPCVPPVSMGCGSAGTNFQFSVAPTETDNGQPRDKAAMNGRKFVIRLRTGDFDPAFSMGGRIESMTRTKLSSGEFTLEVGGSIQAVYGVQTYQAVPMEPQSTYRSRLSDFLKTSKATSVTYQAAVSVYPSAFLKSTSIDLGGQCISMPFTDAYADMNGSGTTLSWVPSKPTDAVASTIKLQIHGPHYLPDSNGNDDKIVPARIRFFLPNAFFTDAGYPDPSRFDAKSLQITAYGNEQTVPVLERRADGILVDYGITHFSVPDPVVTLLRYGRTLSEVQSTVTTTTLPAAAKATSSSPTAVAPTKSVKRGKRLTASSAAATAGLSRPAGSSVSLKVTKGTASCRVSGTALVALKKGTCKVTVTVTTKSRKKTSRSVTVNVT